MAPVGEEEEEKEEEEEEGRCLGCGLRGEPVACAAAERREAAAADVKTGIIDGDGARHDETE